MNTYETKCVACERTINLQKDCYRKLIDLKLVTNYWHEKCWKKAKQTEQMKEKVCWL